MKIETLSFMAIFIVALVAGCVNQTGHGSGVVIESFAPDLNDAYPGDMVTFLVKIRNTGSVYASDGSVSILNLDEWSGCETPCSFEKLVPPDIQAGTPGESKTCSFRCVAPRLPEGTSLTYNPIARLSYSYHSDAVKIIPIMSRQEVVRAIDRGKQLPLEALSSTQGPVGISIKGKGPVTFSSSGEVEFPIEIVIENTGGGTAETEKGRDTVYLEIDPKGMSLMYCDNRMSVSLWKGKSASIVCTLSVPTDKGNIQTEKRINAVIHYQYIQDATASITLRHR